MKRWVNIIVSAIPIIQALVLMLLCFKVSDAIIDIASFSIGNSLLTLIIYVYLYFFSRYRFCDVTKFCVIALVVNHLLHFIGGYISYDLYGDIYTLIFMGSAIVLGLFTDIRRKK